jgi:DNA-binding helix-hairpin-helix protein with protein kinase domain
MTAPRVFDARGKPVPLGGELGRGGEGAVYDLPGQAGGAAKIYLKTPDRAKAEKVAAMVGMATPRLTALSAWPTATLHGAGRELAGFVMPKLAGHRPVFQVYGPKLRLRQFPKADWRFLVHAAGNVARAFAAMHESGLVVGDVNHGNLFVGQDATVQFIDTDSFQVTIGNRRWPCEVGVGTHQPPEMQRLASYRDVIRTPNHDNFGLAVLIFQLLCMGRHPFSGRFTGAGEPPDIERAITESRYAYGADTKRTQMTPPPGALAMASLPADIRVLFEDAFAPGAIRGGRPPPDRWVGALAALGQSLRKCSVNAGHWYAPQAAACPWCEVEARSGIVLFPAVFVGGRPGSSGAALLWQEIEAVQPPPILPKLRKPAASDAQPYPRIKQAGARQRRRRAAAVLTLAAGIAVTLAALPDPYRLIALPVMVLLAAVFWVFPRPPERGEVRDYLAELKELWADLEAEWVPVQAVQSFEATRGKLAGLKRSYDGLAAERERGLRALQSNRQQQQLTAHLESYELSAARIQGIGKAKVATLLSYGIETAADFDPARLAAIPGFGPKTVAAMLAYRAECERRFRFDPNRNVAQSEIAKLDQRFGQRSAQIAAELRSGLAQLKAIEAEETRRQRSLLSREAELRPVLAQALANAAALGLGR